MFNFKLLILSSLVGVYVGHKKREDITLGIKRHLLDLRGLIFAKAGAKDVYKRQPQDSGHCTVRQYPQGAGL